MAAAAAVAAVGAATAAGWATMHDTGLNSTQPKSNYCSVPHYVVQFELPGVEKKVPYVLRLTLEDNIRCPERAVVQQ